MPAAAVSAAARRRRATGTPPIGLEQRGLPLARQVLDRLGGGEQGVELAQLGGSKLAQGRVPTQRGDIDPGHGAHVPQASAGSRAA